MSQISNPAAHRATSSWMTEGSALQDVILASRIRLARNVNNLPFPNLAKPDEKAELVGRVAHLLPSLHESCGKEWQLSAVTTMSKEERGVLVDKHLISPQFAQNPEGASLLLREDEVVSVMLNEEDHLRLQVLCPGQQLSEAWEIASRVDDLMESELDYAFHPDLGYLTSCPTNVGTGLRASVMAHLPALVISKRIGRVLTAINQMGLVVRGLYGEGSEATGQIFQISNQISLGSSEKEVIEGLQGIVKQIVEEERNTRRALQNSSEQELLDRIGRSVGTLANARLINISEAVQLLSDLRLGINLQAIRGIDNEIVSALLVKIQPSWLQQQFPEETTTVAYQRALVLREALQGVTVG